MRVEPAASDWENTLTDRRPLHTKSPSMHCTILHVSDSSVSTAHHTFRTEGTKDYGIGYGERISIAPGDNSSFEKILKKEKHNCFKSARLHAPFLRDERRKG